jgi:sugar phosphate isomerase/epimerase
MKIGVFTALLSKLPLVEVLEKLRSLDIHTVELGTGNYPVAAHRSHGTAGVQAETRRSRLFH